MSTTKRVALAVGAMLVLGTGEAGAADFTGLAPPLYDWAGPYVGVQAGYAWGDVRENENIDGGGLNQVIPLDHIEGVVGGGHAGFNYTMGNVLLGIEGDIEASDADGSFTFTNGDADTADLDWLGSVRGRLGWLIENTLLYATGGVAFGGFDVSIFDAGTTTREAFSETYVGYTVGAGVETMFMPNLSGRIEYRFTDFGEENFDSTAAFPGFNFDFGFEVHAVRAALSWHF